MRFVGLLAFALVLGIAVNAPSRVEWRLALLTHRSTYPVTANTLGEAAIQLAKHGPLDSGMRRRVALTSWSVRARPGQTLEATLHMILPHLQAPFSDQSEQVRWNSTINAVEGHEAAHWSRVERKLQRLPRLMTDRSGVNPQVTLRRFARRIRIAEAAVDRRTDNGKDDIAIAAIEGWARHELP